MVRVEVNNFYYVKGSLMIVVVISLWIGMVMIHVAFG